MRLWRISNYADLSGEGGLRVSGRWHTVGLRIIYLADHPASALLETMVHLEIDAGDLPDDYQLLGVEVPDQIAMTTVEEASLPSNWREQHAATRARGDTWLRNSSTSLMRVPSAIIPEGNNYLLNPTHADAARISIVSVARAAFDSRIRALLEK